MKVLMSLVSSLIVMSFASNALAISNEALAKKCAQAGAQKIVSQAQAWGCQVDLSKLDVQEIDNRWYNPSKYIWYQVEGECNGMDRVIKMVQYYKGQCL